MISEVKRIKDKLKAVKDQDAKMDHSLNNQDKKVSQSKFYFFYIFSFNFENQLKKSVRLTFKFYIRS